MPNAFDIALDDILDTDRTLDLCQCRDTAACLNPDHCHARRNAQSGNRGRVDSRFPHETSTTKYTVPSGTVLRGECGTFLAFGCDLPTSGH